MPHKLRKIAVRSFQSGSAAILENLTGMHHLTTTPARTRVKQARFRSFLGQFDAHSTLWFFLGGETVLAPLNLDNLI